MESNCKKLCTLPESPFLKRLGYGTGVGVFMLERSPIHGSKPSPWAIKRVGKRFMDSILPYDERLAVEAKILRSLNHTNIVSFKGYSKSVDGRFVLAMEKADSCLLDLIENRAELNKGPFPPPQILKVSLDIVSALVYLHNDMHLLHGDIKSANVLVYGDFELCKLCDFGVSLHLDTDMKVLPGYQYVGTECWMAKEVETGIVTDKADIFSYGLTLWEMLSLSVPNVILNDSCESVEFDDSDVSHLDSPLELSNESIQLSEQTVIGKRPPIPLDLDSSYDPAVEIFTVCTIEDYQLRPTALALLSALKTQT